MTRPAFPLLPFLEGKRLKKGHSLRQLCGYTRGKYMTERTPWKSRIFLRYLLYQLPGWALWSVVLLILQQFFVFPLWLVPAALAVWVVKDLILFSYTWMAYGAGHGAKRPLPGFRGVVVKSLSPEGYIRIEGELWRAEAADPGKSIPSGETVTVERINGLTLLVRPVSRDSRRP
jgi:membrane protein implicated in regulation of membrane protease activity